MRYLFFGVALILLFAYQVVVVSSETCTSGTGVEGICVHYSKCLASKVLSYAHGTTYPKRCSNSINRCCQKDGTTKRDGLVYLVKNETEVCANGTGFFVPRFECPSRYIILNEEPYYGSEILTERIGTDEPTDILCCKKEAFTEEGSIKCGNEEEDGICMPYYKCSSNNITFIDAIQIRFDTNTTKDRECPDYWTTCCIPSKNDNRKPTKPIQPVRSGCGYRNEKGLAGVYSHVIKSEAQFGEFPWMVAIYHDEVGNGELKYKCGGSLIAPNVVLTVAHCVNDLKHNVYSIVLRFGEWDTKTTNEILKHEDGIVQSIITHENYQKGPFLNDIALIILTSKVNFEPHINTVCLPPSDMKFDNKKCIVTGWGTDLNDPQRRYAVIMKKIELPIVPRNTCLQQLRTTALTARFSLHESFLCAGGELGVDACKGDGGSPLVCEADNGRYYQVGAVAWGLDCGTRVPGVYVDISRMREWIDQKLKEKGIDQQHYTM